MSEQILSRHHCPAFVLSCMDFRFAGIRTAQAIEKAYGLRENEYDLVALPGGAQNLTQYILAPHLRESAMLSLEIAAERHGVKTVIALSHQNCGALAAAGHTFGAHEKSAEEDFHHALLDEAQKTLADLWPHLKILVGYLAVTEDAQAVIIKKREE